MAKIFLVKKKGVISLCNEYGVILNVTKRQCEKISRVLLQDDDGNLTKFNRKYEDCYILKNNIEAIFKEDSIVFWHESVETGYRQIDTKEGIDFLLDIDLRKVRKCKE
jgi:hypothetical protein